MLGTTLRARHLGRYKELVRLYFKYGRTDLFSKLETEEPVEDEAALLERRPADPDGLARDLERLGPTYVKLGQLLSTRADLIPRRYAEALARLQDSVQPIAFEEVRETIERELGARLHRLFPRFDPKPKASASLGQLHRAQLRDGREVAVKVQRPGVRARFIEDLDAIAEAAEFLEKATALGRTYEFGRVVDDVRKSLFHELDYLEEAHNLVLLAENLRDFPLVVVPQPHYDYTTSRVLTMDFIFGRKVTSLTPLMLTELDGPRLADELFRAYLKQIIVDGFFHADPHPGNVLLTRDRRIALLDLGMVARVGPVLQDDLLELLLAVVEGRSDAAADVAVKIGHKRDDFDEEGARRKIGRLVLAHKDATVSEFDAGRVILEITRVSAASGLRLPSEMTMLGKALLNLDQAVWQLDPEYDPNAATRREAPRLLQRRIGMGMTEGSLFTGLLEIKSFAELLPARLARILELLGSNALKVDVDAIDEERLMEGFQKVANRIAMGVVLGALIVGAALLMRVETRWKVFDYPGLAILCFLAAAAGGVALLLDIVWSDRKRRR